MTTSTDGVVAYFDGADARRRAALEAYHLTAARRRVLEAYDLERARRPFDMTAGRRRRTIHRLDDELAELERNADRNGAGGDELELTALGDLIRNEAALERLAGELIKPAGVSSAVVAALEAARLELGARRPAKLDRALNGAIPIHPSGGSRSRRSSR